MHAPGGCLTAVSGVPFPERLAGATRPVIGTAPPVFP